MRPLLLLYYFILLIKYVVLLCITVFGTAWCKTHNLDSQWDLIVKVPCYAERRALSVEYITMRCAILPILKPVALQYFNPLFGIIKVMLLSYLQSSLIFFFPSYLLLKLFLGEIHHCIDHHYQAETWYELLGPLIRREEHTFKAQDQENI